MMTLLASVLLSWSATPDRPAPASFDRHHGETLEFRCTFSGFADGQTVFGQSADIRLWYQTNGMGAAWWSVPAAVSSNVLSAVFTPAADVGADRYAMYFGAPSNAYASAVLRLRPSPGFTPNVLPAPSPGYIETDPTVPAWAKADNPPASGLTTNDVCNIVTNSASPPGFTEWTMEYSSPDTRPGSHLGECNHGYWELLDGNGYSYDYAEGGEDALELTFRIAGCGFGRTYNPYVNALGLARTVDLPDVKPATQLLLTGADGKTYSIKIDENRSLIIDEVNE